MNEITKLLPTRMEHAEMFVIGATKYINIVRDIVMSMNPGQCAKADEGIQYISGAISDFPTWTVSDSGLELIQSIHEIYDKFTIIDKSLVDIIAVMTNETYAKLASYNVSATYNINMK